MSETKKQGDERNVVELRVEALKAMNTFMCKTNDKYYVDAWHTSGVPDCPQEDCYIKIAKDDEWFKDCYNIFQLALMELANLL